jgi:uncharacterized protein (TIGR02646 family)
MRHIKKNSTESEKFSRWKKRNKSVDWNGFSGGSAYGELKEQLIAEQVGMCCYCEVVLTRNDCHIEHLKPKSIYKKEMFSYDNLLASCNRKESCGSKKGAWYPHDNADNMVSPLNASCEQRFTYTLDGRIIPSDEEDAPASETIEQLGLNCSKLKDRRRSIIMALDNGGNGPEPDYLQAVAKGILTRESGWPFGFYTILFFLAEMYEIPFPH